MNTINQPNQMSLRPCMIGDKKALFHCWAMRYELVGASPLRGGHPGGQLSQLFGIVEFENGVVAELVPQEIRFVDTDLYMTDQKSQEHDEPKKSPVVLIRKAIEYAKVDSSKAQYNYAEGLLNMAFLTDAITPDQRDQLREELESIKGWCYSDNQIEKVVNRIQHGVIYTINKVPAISSESKAVRNSITSALETFFNNFKEEGLDDPHK